MRRMTEEELEQKIRELTVLLKRDVYMFFGSIYGHISKKDYKSVLIMLNIVKNELDKLVSKKRTKEVKDLNLHIDKVKNEITNIKPAHIHKETIEEVKNVLNEVSESVYNVRVKFTSLGSLSMVQTDKEASVIKEVYKYNVKGIKLYDLKEIVKLEDKDLRKLIRNMGNKGLVREFKHKGSYMVMITDKGSDAYLFL